MNTAAFDRAAFNGGARAPAALPESLEAALKAHFEAKLATLFAGGYYAREAARDAAFPHVVLLPPSETLSLTTDTTKAFRVGLTFGVVGCVSLANTRALGDALVKAFCGDPGARPRPTWPHQLGRFGPLEQGPRNRSPVDGETVLGRRAWIDRITLNGRDVRAY